MKKGVKQRGGGAKGWAIALGLLVGLFVIAGVAYAMDVAANQNKIPRAVSVGGVDISSMDRNEAVDKLRADLGGVENEPVTVTAGDMTAEFIPAQAGLSLDFQAAVDGIAQPSLNPITRLASFFKPMSEYDVDTQVDQVAFTTAMDRVHEELVREPKDGAVNIDGGKVNVTDAVMGQEVDRAVLDDAIQQRWLDPQGVQVEPVEKAPAIDEEEVEEIAEGPAAKAVDGALNLKGRKDVTASIEPEGISQFVHIDSVEGHLEVTVDSKTAQGIFAEALASTVTPMRNAQISFAGGQKQVTPHSDGETIDWDTTMDGFSDRVLGDKGRDWDADYVDEPASFTTEDAENATFDDVIGEFSTSGFTPASGRNIQLVAQEVNGAIVAPGDVFSLNGYTGTRGTEQGYVESGIIIDGHAGTAVGGGISQFATTLYNAAYFAGMGDVAHTPHSYYISRYPPGREATVFEGAIDLKFENTSSTPVLIETSFGGGSITVRLKGVKTVEVESINNGRWAPTQPQPMDVEGDDCSPSAGAPGFTTSDTRIIRDLNGNELSRETTTTVYDPQPIVRCG